MSASSRQQNVIATSAPTAETVEIFHTLKKLEGLRQLCLDLGVNLGGPAVVLTDSQTSTKSFRKPVSAKNKHMALYYNYIREKLNTGKFQVHFISRRDNVADLNTKQGTATEFERLWCNASSSFKWKHMLMPPR